MNRRNLLQSSLAASLLPAAAQAAPRAKTLVIYFSRADENYGVGVVSRGNTAVLADIVAGLLGDVPMFEVRAKAPYPKVYSECTDLAKAEQRRRARPELAKDFTRLDEFDTILLGFPTWWGDLPMPLFTFLEQHPLDGKTILPFNTHEGSGFGRTLSSLARLCPKARIKEGYETTGQSAQNNREASRRELADWLKAQGIL